MGVHEVCLFLAWGGLVYDLSIGILLLIPRTRMLGIAMTFVFHATNHRLLPIGVFPAMAFTATLIFLEADWPASYFVCLPFTGT